MTPAKRKKILLKSRVQHAMILHTAAHWALFIFGTLGLLMAWQMLFGEPSDSFGEHFSHMWNRHGPAFVILLVLMPVVVYDTMKLGHRVAGPMVRLGGAIKRLSQGEKVQPVRFREEDFWHEIAGDFNTLLQRLEKTEAAPSVPAAANESPDFATT